MFVFEHQDEFRLLVDPKKPEKGRRLCLLTIFERLYTGGVCSKPIPSFLHVLDYAVSFMWQSFNSERAGSHINRVRTPGRIGLGAGTLNSLVFGTSNSAPLQELDAPRPLAMCLAGGHMSGMTAGSADEGQSKVLKRHLEGTSKRFLRSKGEVLAGCIQSNKRAYDAGPGGGE
jgi:hypothetical protein